MKYFQNSSLGRLLRETKAKLIVAAQISGVKVSKHETVVYLADRVSMQSATHPEATKFESGKVVALMLVFQKVHYCRLSSVATPVN